MLTARTVAVARLTVQLGGVLRGRKRAVGVLMVQIGSLAASPEGNTGGGMSQQGFDASSINRSTWIAGVRRGPSSYLDVRRPGGRCPRCGFSVNASGWDTGALGKLIFFVALIAVIAVVVDHMDVDVSSES